MSIKHLPDGSLIRRKDGAVGVIIWEGDGQFVFLHNSEVSGWDLKDRIEEDDKDGVWGGWYIDNVSKYLGRYKYGWHCLRHQNFTPGEMENV